jgi:hypothetical protein
VAVQGPSALALCRGVVPAEVDKLLYYYAAATTTAGSPAS